jgi:hypothetical protein
VSELTGTIYGVEKGYTRYCRAEVKSRSFRG